tara:strand:+ start:8 stop:877 length:870 start_codon:yes stop_codon:yes gene_type:complete
MILISSEEFLSWEKKQLLKGGDKKSLHFLLDSLEVISSDQINLLKIDSTKKLNLRKNLENIEQLWDKHLHTGNPIQYLSGITFWRDLKLKVTDKVLIPRPETEFVIDIIVKIFKKNMENIFFAELGTGSGAISIALALDNPSWNGIATDVDENVLDLAKKNFLNCSNQSNLKFCSGHWWNPLESFRGELDLVVSNPPYIPRDIYEKLPKEVKNFEPKIALLGGDDGLLHIKEIVQNAPVYLKKDGWLVIENHFDQGAAVRQLFLENKFSSVEVLKDLFGIGRFTIGSYK